MSRRLETLADIALAAVLALVFAAAVVHWIDLEGITSGAALFAVRPELLQRAVRLWRCPWVPRNIRRHNQRQWLRSVALLGDKWKLARPMSREVLRAQAAQRNGHV